MSESDEMPFEFQYERGKKYALVSEGRMPVALLSDMKAARQFVKRSERYSLETPPGSNVVSIQYPVAVIDKVQDE